MRTTRRGVFPLLVGALLATMTAARAQKAATSAARPKIGVTAAQANAVALKRFPGRIVGKTARENEKGRWQYAVVVRSGKTLREVMVNARTGRIDSVEITTEAEERAEKRAEAKTKKAKTPGRSR